jgi:hypothetical protein
VPVGGLDLGVDDLVGLVRGTRDARCARPRRRCSRAWRGTRRDLTGVGAGVVDRQVLGAVRSASLSPSTRVCTERRSVNGGSTATSTAPKSCLPSRSVQSSFCTRCVACRWSRFIFQLPASSGVRPCGHASCLLREDGDAGQFLALEVLQARTTTGGDVPELVVGEAELAHRGSGVAAADDGEGARARGVDERLGDGLACPRRTGPSRRRPSGPFQKTVRASASLLGIQLRRLSGRCPGPSCRPGWRRRHDGRLGVGGELGRRDDVDRQDDLDAGLLGPLQVALAGSMLSASSRLLPTS